jgi:hypothetical protein
MAALDSANRSSSRFAAFALGLALLGAGSMVYYHSRMFLPRARETRAATGLGSGYSFGNDFYQVWVTCRECPLNRCDPYGAEMTRTIQTGLFGRPLNPQIPTDTNDLRMFPYPAFTLLLFWPTAGLPFEVVRIAVVLLLVAMTFASVLLWLGALAWRPNRNRQAMIVLLTMASYPVLEGLYAAQLGLLVGFLLAASIVSLQRGRHLLAGLLIALTTIKPQVTLLVIVYLLLWSFHDWRRRGRFFAGLCLLMLVLLGASLAVRPNWIQSWAHTVLAYHQYAPPPLVTIVLSSLVAPRAAVGATIVMLGALLIFALVLAWRHRAAAADSLEFWLTLSLLLAITSITLLPGQAVYDHVILLPGILFLARYWRELRHHDGITRILLPVGAIVLFWPWVAAFGLLVLSRLPSRILDSTAVLSLPIRTAASLPFAVLALLAYATRVHLVRSRESA